jgi:tripartite-type tricarboxylate transporter receptor subunit TctC
MKIFGSLSAAALVATSLAGSLPTAAQEYPDRTTHLIVPQAAGGATDTFARIIGQKLSERWKQPVVVENRPGAGGIIGTDAVAKAVPDGYTLLVTYEGTQAINQSLYEKIPFDSVKDFQPIATIAVTPFMLVAGTQNKAVTLKDFIAYARANPDKVTYGSAGIGSVNHLLGEMLKADANIRIVHVPYKGVAQAISDVIGGHVDAAFASAPSVISTVRQGLVRALAVSSGTRAAISPDTPTIAEAGVEKFDVDPWFGVLGPAGLSPEITQKISRDVAEVLETPELKDLLSQQGAAPLVMSPDAFRSLLEKDIGKWARIIKAAGIKMY